MKPIAPEVFRAYDVRGLVDVDFDPEWVETLGRACGTYFLGRGQNRAVVGHDCRHSSPGYQAALTAGLTASGVDVVYLGMVPTPVFYFAAKHLGIDAGIMATASHNPPQFNGFKIYAGGSTIHTAEIRAVFDLMASGAFASGRGLASEHDVVPTYLDEVVSGIRLGRETRVVVDGGNGAGGLIAAEALRRAGARVVPLFCEPDGDFPNHHPDPVVPENMTALCRTVVAEKADFGAGLDGDADRLGVADEAGALLYGDQLLAIYARDVLRERPGAAVIGEVKCSHRLYADIAARGGRPIMGAAGHSLIKAAMRQTGAPLAGEMSGHMFFADRYLGFDDAIYAALRLAEIVSNSPTPLGHMLDDWPQTAVTPEIRINCPDAVKFEVVRRVAAHLKDAGEVNAVDGLRLSFPDGWGLVRASNTQPALVLRFEAETPERLAAIRDLIETPVTAWVRELGG